MLLNQGDSFTQHIFFECSLYANLCVDSGGFAINICTILLYPLGDEQCTYVKMKMAIKF